ncbi:MAG: OmpA family protein [Granulosicoccus sp.]|nr:OmpA family protein [Granulosicoccus sp.]
MDDDDDEGGGAGWIMTFADLMSLLMCFFVLLLSFSEMDLQKYKQVAGSMKFAFGIQRKIKSDVVPKGTSLVTDKYSPGRPDPNTVINEIRQQTTDETLDDLEVDKAELAEQAEDLKELLKTILEEEIEEGMLDLVQINNNVYIRVREKDSFPSGSVTLTGKFLDVLSKLVKPLNAAEGRLIVGGHTDSVPISTAAYQSNWVLSAGRAASVVHALTDFGLSQQSRIEIRAFADTKPVVVEDDTNRARNRRIEINIELDGVLKEDYSETESFPDFGYY